MDGPQEPHSEWKKAHKTAWGLYTRSREISEQTGPTCSGGIRTVVASWGMGVRIHWEETGGHLLVVRAISW